MAGAIPRPGLHTHTLTAYTDASAVRDALGIVGSGQVVALLVADGIVRWHAAGPPDRERIEDLRAALGGLEPHRGSALLRRLDMTKIRVPATLTCEHHQS